MTALVFVYRSTHDYNPGDNVVEQHYIEYGPQNAPCIVFLFRDQKIDKYRSPINFTVTSLTTGKALGEPSRLSNKSYSHD